MPTGDNRFDAMLFDYPTSIPVGLGILPAAWMKYREELSDVLARYPDVYDPNGLDRDFDAVGGTYIQGDHVDAWGCVWTNISHGMESIVTHHPVPTREAVRALRPPEKDSGFPHGFMWLRLADLRGFENVMMDFAEEAPELQMLIDTVLEYNMRQIENVVRDIGPDPRRIQGFGDDLGMQYGLAISPEQWRKYMKPCYAKIYGRCHDMGWNVYMHTDGHIVEIIPDLIDCGVNVINPQVRANGLDNLARVAKGKVCISLDLDRQMFPFGTPDEIDNHVREAVEILGSREGGLWLSAEIGPDVPIENCEAICAALSKYRNYFA
jgi:hypothetical protein